MDELLLEYSALGAPQRQVTPSTAVKHRQVSSSAGRTKLFSPCVNVTPKYDERKSKGEVIFSFGRASSKPWDCFSNLLRSHGSSSLVKLKLCEQANALTSAYNYMYQLPYDIMIALSNRIDHMGALVADFLPDDEVIWSRVDSIQNEEPVYICGQITSLEDSTERLDMDSVGLQSSWSNSAGSIVALNFSAVDSFSVFPGQFIALRGLNPDGKGFIVDKVVPLPMPNRRVVDAQTMKTAGDFNVICAAGPFTTSDNLDFQPLQDLLEHVADKQPDILILIGPFVPSNHPLIEKNLLSCSHDKIFDVLLGDYIRLPLEETRTKIVIVSSPKDVFHDPVYPSAPYKDYKSASGEKVMFASDPCLLDINGVTFGLTSTDSLFHMSRQEISNSNNNRMNRLLEHLITQRSFYPLYPPNEDLNVDFVHAHQYCSMDVLPDVLVLPSTLRQFSQEVCDVCCLNPGHLSKGEGGGTFARIKVNLSQSSKSKVTDWIGAEIVKI